MNYKKKFLLIIITVFLFSCGGKKKKASLGSDDNVEISDFIAFFSPVKLPFAYSDAGLMKKESDSLLISNTNFKLFIPDTVITSAYGKTVPKIYGLGKAEAGSGETYYFIKTVSPKKNALVILAFDNANKFIAAHTALLPDNNNNTVQSVTMDSRFSIIHTTQLKNRDGGIAEGKDVYALNASANSFMLIMTDPIVDNTELINPIDTLPATMKWTADYAGGKANLVSIRDGRRNNMIEFFIHFNKNNGQCSGEIKGEAMMKTANTAEYRERGEPCVLKFIFSSSSVTLQEVEGCGSKRPLDCTLNGKFTKKKQSKPSLKDK